MTDVKEVKKEEIKQIDLSFIDKVIGFVSPSTLSTRLSAQQEVSAQRAMLAMNSYHGYTSTIPTLDRPSPMNSGILRSEEAELPGWDRFTLIMECRNLYRNDPIIRSGVDGIARRIGIARPHMHTSDEEWNKEAYKQWCDWCENCDIKGQMCFDEIQETVPKACYQEGDLGIQFYTESDDLKLGIKEGDLIAAPMRTDMNIDNNSPLGGIVWDIETGHIKGYLVGRRGMGGMLIDTKEIPKSDFLLLFRRQRTDEMRGVPLLAPIIDTAKDLHDYLNSTRIQARIAATFGVVIKKNAAAAYGQQISTPTVLPDQSRTIKQYNGKATILQPDEDISMFKADVPGPLFDTYAKFQIRMIARGMGTTYEHLLGDFSNMSFSSSKTNLMIENNSIQHWHRWKVRMMLTPIYNLWVAKRMQSGLLPFNVEAYDKISWPQPASIGINPQEDADSDIKLIAAGLMDYDTYFRQNYGDANWQGRLEHKAKQAGEIQKLAKKYGCNPLDIASTLQPGVVRAEVME